MAKSRIITVSDIRCLLSQRLILSSRLVSLYFRPSRPVLNGLSNVVSFNYSRIIQVSDSPGQLKDTVECPRREVKLLHGRLQQALGGLFHLAETPDFRRRHIGVAGQACSPEPLQLKGAGSVDPGLDGC